MTWKKGQRPQVVHFHLSLLCYRSSVPRMCFLYYSTITKYKFNSSHDVDTFKCGEIRDQVQWQRPLRPKLIEIVSHHKGEGGKSRKEPIINRLYLICGQFRSVWRWAGALWPHPLVSRLFFPLLIRESLLAIMLSAMANTRFYTIAH